MTLHQAKDLDSRKNNNECNASADIYLKGRKLHTTPVFKRNHNPMWEASTEVLVTDKRNAVFGIQVTDNRSLGGRSSLGSVSVKLSAILEATAAGQEWYPLKDVSSGKIRMSATWRPLGMSGSANSARDFEQPIGIIRLWIKKATDLKNVEALTGGKSDPYCRVLVAGNISARTMVHDNDLDPDFDEIVYVPVQQYVRY